MRLVGLSALKGCFDEWEWGIQEDEVGPCLVTVWTEGHGPGGLGEGVQPFGVCLSESRVSEKYRAPHVLVWEANKSSDMRCCAR